MPYCLLMDGLAKAGQMCEAKLIFDEMKRKHVRSGKVFFWSLIFGKLFS